LHVEVEPATNDVEMVVDEARQDAPALEVDDLGLRTCQRHHLAVGADSEEPAFANRDGGSGRLCARERGEEAAMEDQISARFGLVHVFSSRLESILGCAACW